MTPQSAKAKGRRLQQIVRDKILGVFIDILTQDDVRSTSMGAGGVDIQLSQLAKECFPFSVECKWVEKLNIRKAFEQSQQNKESGTIPILIHKKNHQEILITLSLDDFFSVVYSNKKSKFSSKNSRKQ